MAKKWTLMRSRLFEISFEKTETICVAKRRETVVVASQDVELTDADQTDRDAGELPASATGSQEESKVDEIETP
jgi:hypothetical protein